MSNTITRTVVQRPSPGEDLAQNQMYPGGMEPAASPEPMAMPEQQPVGIHQMAERHQGHHVNPLHEHAGKSEGAAPMPGQHPCGYKTGS